MLVGVTILGWRGRPALGQGKDHGEVPSDGFASVSGQRLPGAERAARVLTPREFLPWGWPRLAVLSPPLPAPVRPSSPQHVDTPLQVPVATVSCGDMANTPSSVCLLWRQPCLLALCLSCRRRLPILYQVSQISRPPDLRGPPPLPGLASPKLEALRADAVSWGCRNEVPHTGRMKTTETCFLALEVSLASEAPGPPLATPGALGVPGLWQHHLVSVSVCTQRPSVCLRSLSPHP